MSAGYKRDETTIAEYRAMKQRAEAEILTSLRTFIMMTGAEVSAVNVRTLADSEGGYILRTIEIEATI